MRSVGTFLWSPDQLVLALILVALASVGAGCTTRNASPADEATSAREQRSAEKNSALIRLSESSRSAIGKIAFTRQNGVQQVFTAIWELQGEVNNGGFHQYFFNYSGESSGVVVSALDTIGAHQTRQIVADAIDRFPGGRPSTNTDERRRILAKVDPDIWNDLDDAFFTYPDDLTELLYAFVKSHPEEFGSEF